MDDETAAPLARAALLNSVLGPYPPLPHTASVRFPIAEETDLGPTMEKILAIARGIPRVQKERTHPVSTVGALSGF